MRVSELFIWSISFFFFQGFWTCYWWLSFWTAYWKELFSRWRSLCLNNRALGWNTVQCGNQRRILHRNIQQKRYKSLKQIFYPRNDYELLLIVGELRHIKDLKPWSLESVLCEKYHFSKSNAAEFAEFLLPMLAVDKVRTCSMFDSIFPPNESFIPKAKRASASTCLKHRWLQTGYFNWLFAFNFLVLNCLFLFFQSNYAQEKTKWKQWKSSKAFEKGSQMHHYSLSRNSNLRCMIRIM